MLIYKRDEKITLLTVVTNSLNTGWPKNDVFSRSNQQAKVGKKVHLGDRWRECIREDTGEEREDQEEDGGGQEDEEAAGSQEDTWSLQGA